MLIEDGAFVAHLCQSVSTRDGKLLIHHNVPLNISPRQVKRFVVKRSLFPDKTDDSVDIANITVVNHYRE